MTSLVEYIGTNIICKLIICADSNDYFNKCVDTNIICKWIICAY